MSIKILIVDDHGILRAGVKLIIDQTDDMKIVGQACNGHEGIELARKLKPDVVLMDISMPGLNGIEATKEIVSENPDIKILALSAYCNRRFIKDMLKAGVSGYALKDTMADELIYAIKSVHAGQRYLSEKVTKLVVDDYTQGGSSDSAEKLLDKLTNRERGLLQLIAENKTTKETAKLLHVSVKTIEARRLNIIKKLGVSGTAELTKIAIREGLTSIDF
ncbi:MAG: response regulator transcription factor [Candidatus Omnitrophica bacterium]|nr:response regulator transcription factor [Candidatus Omnitrophota bacterium]